MKIFLPYRGEFGYHVFFHAPQVHACHGRKVVCCERGMEALYPGACRYIDVPPRPDHLKRGVNAIEPALCRQYETMLAPQYPDAEFVAPNHAAPREYFEPHPIFTYDDIEADVVICPRRRDYGDAKNWDHWAWIADRLEAAGLRVFAGGSRVASSDVGCPAAWRYTRPLDATLQAIHAAKLVIATDAGLAHLAVACGRPLLMIAYGDRTAPGYPPINFGRYYSANHRGSMIYVCGDGWSDPAAVLDRVSRLVG